MEPERTSKSRQGIPRRKPTPEASHPGTPKPEHTRSEAATALMDEVEMASRDSFPCSDPPAYNSSCA